MQYKTLTLQLMEQQPQLHTRLKNSGKLLTELDRFSTSLKTSHATWATLLSEQTPGNPNQIASAALEFALKDLEQLLSTEQRAGDNEPLDLDAAMAFVRAHTPPE